MQIFSYFELDIFRSPVVVLCMHFANISAVVVARKASSAERRAPPVAGRLRVLVMWRKRSATLHLSGETSG